MNLVFEKLKQTLAANQTIQIGIAANFFSLTKCAWPVTVTLLQDNQIIGRAVDMLAGDFLEDIEFDAVWITNGAIAQEVGWQITGGNAGSTRVMGEVSVINGELNRVKANQCFIGVSASINVAGQCSAGQLWNPAASGKNLVLNKVSVMSGTGGANMAYWLNRHNAALTTLMAGMPQSKLIGGAAPVAEIRTAANAAMIGAQLAYVGTPGVYESKDFQLAEPVIVPPGYGFVVQATIVNVASFATFQWNEEAI